VQQGTQHSQRVITGTLDSLPALAAQARLAPPTLIIVGDVVRLREKLKWFERAQSAAAPGAGAVEPFDAGAAPTRG
jgi:uroporphyrin-III C-methyltransferase/precorrin-2 dehydrogenase/sirohydrochlorin ferrochelatase